MQRIPGDINLKLRIEEVVSLNRYTIEARYPGDWEPFNREEAEKAVAIARKVRKAVKTFLPTEME
jgi:HEPN domain-containing protein